MSTDVRPRAEPTGPGAQGPAASVGVRRLALVGGGPVAASVLAALADELPATGAPVPWEVILLDRNGETGGGEPHAAGTSAALLLNDRLAAIDSTGIGFAHWLATHRKRWVADLAADPEPLVAAWLADHADQLCQDRFDDLFLPRVLLGEFLRQRFAAARRRLAARGVPVRVLTGEVRTVRAAGDGWLLTVLDAPAPIAVDTALLGLGSPLPPPPPVADHPGFFSYSQAREVPTFRARLSRLLAAPDDGCRRVVVLGSAAAACEVLYLLEGTVASDVVVLSRSGRLPDGLPSGIAEPFTCRELSGLETVWAAGTEPPSSAELVEAVIRDVAAGRDRGYTIVDMLPALGAAFGSALPQLPPTQVRRFVETDSPRYRRAIRHTSTDYALAIRRLVAAGRLSLGRAAVTDVAPGPAGQLVVTAGDTRLPAVAVIDCRGFADVRTAAGPLLRDLLATGTVTANPSFRGLDVNERLEAAPGLFVLGPLLAGTSRGADQIWSLENVPRIHVLAKRVAGEIRTRLGVDAPGPSRGGLHR
ncbi:FAD/NAD(P)-binding protein [Plantactinospora sp. S1510]|uniref:FAD/NAD(P)-binding protein n=1 Tax=Plantactinospora alkalitolerans TaxID=2789879 RepID=A0ABS0H3L3_9ACTN|nr:FAD/NAD(P)-binding protein [Plantactinospora alkalitolerans]MBF9132803.1 FAD/NAD(P)-binding protein [Plantactinospora alkalitolerans]